MIRPAPALWVILSAALVFFGCAQAVCATYKSADGSIVLSAASIDIAKSKLVARGGANIKVVRKQDGTSFDASADSITVVMTASGGSKKGPVGMDAIKSAQMTGSVNIVYTRTEETVVVTTTASAREASYDGAEQVIRMTGQVKVTHEDASMFEQPAVLTGDTAAVNVKPDLGPEDFRFRIESSPGVSRIEVYPREKAQ